MATNRKASMAKRQREMDQKDRVKERSSRRDERQARAEARKANGEVGAPVDEIQFNADGSPILPVIDTDDGISLVPKDDGAGPAPSPAAAATPSTGNRAAGGRAAAGS